MKRILAPLTLTLFLLACGKPSVEIRKPEPCRVSYFPTTPSDVVIETCLVGETSYICFLPNEIAKIGTWADQVERWFIEVKNCPYIEETVVP